MVISLLEDLGYATAELILSGERTPDDLPRLERIVTATADALERVLGAPAGCLQHASCEGLSQWLVPTSATMVWYPGSEDDDGLVKEVREEYHSKKRLLDGSLENVLRDMNAL